MSTSKTEAKKTDFIRDLEEGVRPEHELYQGWDVESDKELTNKHYELPTEFFYCLTGGKWNIYSANWWGDGIETSTQSQEAKMDLLAEHMDLKPGMRIMDVGCGWAGPITYLAEKYDVRGVGLTLSQPQKEAADKRIAEHSVDVNINICHWAEFEDDEKFDVIYTDEVIVHFYDLPGFFQKVHSLLKPGGIMVNKEVHYSRKEYLTALDRGEAFINKIFGLTGNYRTLWEELQFVDQAGFEYVWHTQMESKHYATTLSSWVHNAYEHRERMTELTNEETWRNFRMYCRLARAGFSTSTPVVDIVTSRKVG